MPEVLHTVTIDSRRAQRLLTSVKDNFRACKAGWQAAEVIYRQHVTKTFRTGGDPQWQPLAASTIRRRRQGKNKKNPKALPLRDTGDLEKSLIKTGAAQHIGTITATSLEFGTSVPYGFYHQTGAGVPQREFLTTPRTILIRMANAQTRVIIAQIRRENP